MTVTVINPVELVVSPDDLIGRFCHISDTGDLARPAVESGVLTCRGFCGNEGGSGDSWVVGFDDGFGFIDYLTSRGWTALADKGHWPLTVFASFADDGVYGVVEYREGDLTISQFDSEDGFKEFRDRLS